MADCLKPAGTKILADFNLVDVQARPKAHPCAALGACTRAAAQCDTMSTSNTECELAVDSSAFEGITFSRTFGLQPWANSYPAGEKSASIKIGTRLQYLETAPWVDMCLGRYPLLAPYFSREKALFIA